MENPVFLKGINAKDEKAWEKLYRYYEAINRFYDILYQMPQQQRDILMHSLKGLKVYEIAEAMHISENSVKTQKKRAYLFVRNISIPLCYNYY